MSKLLNLIRKKQAENILEQKKWIERQEKIDLTFLKFLQQTFKNGYLNIIERNNVLATNNNYSIESENKIYIGIIETIITEFFKEILKIISADLLVSKRFPFLYIPGTIYDVQTCYPHIVHFMISKRFKTTSQFYYFTVSELKGQFVNMKLELNKEFAMFYFANEDNSDMEFSDRPIKLNLIPS